MSHVALCYTPPRPSKLRECMFAEDDDLHDDDAAQYLKDLRAQKASRPSGSRPPPPSKFASLRRTETTPTEPHPHDDRPSLPSSNSMPIMPAARPSHRRAESDVRVRSPFAGRPLARPPSATPELPISPALERPKELPRPMSMPYMENGMRWMEKQEAKSLRMALEDMDLEEETKIHSAAQDEAAELVWKHQNLTAALANAEAPYANPEVQRDYRSHLRKGSYQRSLSQEQVPLAESRKSSGGSQRASMDMSTATRRGGFDAMSKVSPPTATMSLRKTRTPSGKSYGGLAEAVDIDIAKAFRRSSGGSKRIMSGEKKLYMHRNDRIYEDPEEAPTPPKLEPIAEPVKPAITPVQPPGRVRNNPFARVRLQQHAKLEHSISAPVLPMSKHDSVEIQRNTPTQSKRAWYTSNEPLPPTPPSSREQPADDVAPKSTPTKDGKEIRGDDIRAATSKQRKDRSPNLPQPTLVSDKPGRPIVSFKQDWRPKEVLLEEVHTAALPEPLKVNRVMESPRSAVPIPKINVPDIEAHEAQKPSIPTIVFPDDATIPSIVLPEEPDFATSGSTLNSAPTTPAFNIEPPTFAFSSPDDNPAPIKQTAARRPLPIPTRPGLNHAATAPLPMAKPHSTPYARPSGALCAHCALPIAGRILSAAGERFHPGCFVCHQCNTNLECVAFYPEPENKRADRFARIAARQAGADVPIPAHATREDLLCLEAEDGHPSLRFYCHLDFHELFSPRCKSCRTPIEGEVIVACGAEWHAGHFFCAQCGDPFEARTPFVEREGYAWCVGCHTKRTSAKCRGCKGLVVDEVVVKALGGEWHGGCFVCTECKGDFGDGRYFLRGESQDPVCVKCEERRLKA
ncbi:hypothetical protein B0A55_02208 [Friedmanniomyces simplex]|uniref:LIM zinc-binding domain-containing protein n=1 Tax=Friedmanniomyces simplex TaxID=329884 RepID=A0A4U0XRP8_9PEZI|nr:hypothetical protein B0A55_02208 [Friedmanniomyces simplex]